jgi:hypothetical protein
VGYLVVGRVCDHLHGNDAITSDAAEGKSVWSVYESALKGAKYVELTHTITPNFRLGPALPSPPCTDQGPKATGAQVSFY